MLKNITVEAEEPETIRRAVLPEVKELLRERYNVLPVWIRAPIQGPEYYSGFSRAKLYQLAAAGLIRSVSIRPTGKIRGTRLFELQSILTFIEREAQKSELRANGSATPEKVKWTEDKGVILKTTTDGSVAAVTKEETN
jgi:hypothetical protein